MLRIVTQCVVYLSNLTINIVHQYQVEYNAWLSEKLSEATYVPGQASHPLQLQVVPIR